MGGNKGLRKDTSGGIVRKIEGGGGEWKKG